MLDFSVGYGNGNYHSDSTGLTLTIVPAGALPAAGSYRLQLHADDGAASATDTVDVTVTGGAAVAPAAGLVGWWPGDGHARDLVSRLPTTTTGGLGYAEGRVGPAFSFDGVDDAVTVPSPPATSCLSLAKAGSSRRRSRTCRSSSSATPPVLDRTFGLAPIPGRWA